MCTNIKQPDDGQVLEELPQIERLDSVEPFAGFAGTKPVSKPFPNPPEKAYPHQRRGSVGQQSPVIGVLHGT